MDKKKKIIIIASCIVAVIVIGLVVFFLTKDNKKKDDTPKPTPAVAKESFTISFDTDGGEKLEDLKVEKGKEFTLPTPTKKEYTFDGWYLDDKKVDNSYTFTKDVTLVAKWTEETKTLKVVFDSNGGSKVKDMTFTCADGAATLKNLPTPTKDNYDFRAWEDKHGTPILNGASITCDGDLKLYAVWEEVKKPETKPDVKEKKWTCPEGYELKDTNKCVSMIAVEYKCPDGYNTEKNGVCVNISSRNEGTRKCKKLYLQGDYREGTYIQATGGPAYCGYMELSSYTGTRTGCENANGTYSSINNRCYRQLMLNNYETVCQTDELYFEAQSFGGGSMPGCYKIKQQKESTCKSGYTINYTYGKCVKTIDAELK